MAYTDHTPIPPGILLTRSSNGDARLGDLSAHATLMLVFLRHLGCTFCRETLLDLHTHRAEIKGRGVNLALVHLVREDLAAPIFTRMKLADLPRFSDPDKAIYTAFGLKQGTSRQIFGPRVIARGISAGIVGGIGFGKPLGDYKQMPGVFIMRAGKVVAGYLHDSAADRPDYCNFIDRTLRP